MLTALNDSVGLSIRLFVDAWRTMSAGAQEHAEESAGAAHYVFSGLPISFFNVVLVTRRDVSTATLSASGREACDWASKRDIPWLFVITHEALAAGTDPVAALEPCGLAPLMPLTGMIARQVAPPSNVPPELQLVRPQDDGDCSALLQVNGATLRWLQQIRHASAADTAMWSCATHWSCRGEPMAIRRRRCMPPRRAGRCTNEWAMPLWPSIPYLSRRNS
jgi:hypothetical protein